MIPYTQLSLSAISDTTRVLAEILNPKRNSKVNPCNDLQGFSLDPCNNLQAYALVLERHIQHHQTPAADARHAGHGQVLEEHIHPLSNMLMDHYRFDEHIHIR